MKIALCYSGQPRNIRDTLENHRKYLLPSTEYEIDKFAHFWFDESQAGENFNSEEASRGKWDAGIREWVLANGNFKKIKFEKPEERNLHFIYESLKPDARMERPMPATCPAIQRMISMFYSMEQASLLMGQYEEENSFKYDLVFRLRTDLFIHPDWAAGEHFDASSVYVIPGNWRTVHLGEVARQDARGREIVRTQFGLSNVHLYQSYFRDAVKVKGIKDQFAVGGSDPMKKYVSVYSNLDSMIEEGAVLNPECLLGFNAKINDIEIRKLGGKTNLHISLHRARRTWQNIS